MRFCAFWYVVALSTATWAGGTEELTFNNPTQFLEIAQERIHQFLPNAEFHGVIFKPYNKLEHPCTLDAWEYIFVDKATEQVGYVLQRQDKMIGWPNACVTRFDVRIQETFDAGSFTAVKNPEALLKIGYLEASELVQKDLKRRFLMQAADMRVRDEGKWIELVLTVETANQDVLVYRINMTNGKLLFKPQS